MEILGGFNLTLFGSHLTKFGRLLMKVSVFDVSETKRLTRKKILSTHVELNRRSSDSAL